MLTLKEKQEIILKAQRELLDKQLEEFKNKFKLGYYDRFQFHQFLVKFKEEIEAELDKLWKNKKLF